MNKGDTPPRSIQNEEEYLQEEADIKEVEEELEDGEIEIEWDGSEAELVLMKMQKNLKIILQVSN